MQLRRFRSNFAGEEYALQIDSKAANTGFKVYQLIGRVRFLVHVRSTSIALKTRQIQPEEEV